MKQNNQQQEDITLREGNYHIFDIPKMIVFCGEKKLGEFYRFLKTENLLTAFKCEVGLTYKQKNEKQNSKD